MKFKFLILFISLIVSFAGHSQSKVKIVTEPFPPYFEEQLLNKGWLYQIVKESFEQVGIDVELEFVNWARAQHLTKRNINTALLGVYWREDRDKDFYFSRKIAYSETGLFTIKEPKLLFKNVRELKKYTIAKSRGAAISKDFDDLFTNNVLETSDLISALKLLISGNVDFVAGTKEIGLFWLKNHPELKLSQSVKFLSPPLSKQALYLAFSKKEPEHLHLINKFNEGFNALLTSRRVNDILTIHGWNKKAQKKYIKELSL